MGAEPHQRRPFSVTWALLAAAVLLGAGLRFYQLGRLPPGLYHDEAFNGQDALRILRGEYPVYFEANNGREPLFLYGMALSLAALGRTPFAVRVPAAILGTLTIPATFLMGRALLGERVGLWSAILIAGAPWPVNLSRIGLRAVSLPLVLALAVWLWWSGRRSKDSSRTARFVLAGALFGLSLYTYTAARFVIAVLVAFALYQLWVRHEQLDRAEWLSLALAAFLVAVPMLVYGATHWTAFAERTAQVSILSPAVSHGDPLGTLARNVWRAAGLFTFQGDDIPRHNIPKRPLFDPLISLFFAIGAFLCVWRTRRQSACALCVIWTAVMLLPTMLAEDCPHFLRAVGVLPVAAAFPAMGLEWTRDRLAERNYARVGDLLIGLVLVVSFAWGAYDYLWRHLGDPEELGYSFEADQLREAIEINRFLGTGWQGQGIREPKGNPDTERRVFLGPRMWEDRIAVNLFVGSPEQVSILGRDPPAESDRVLALAWPHADMSDVREVLPSPATITVWDGPLERGDLDAEPRLLYVAFRGEALDVPSDVVGRFEGGIELLDWQAEATEDGKTQLDLRWRAARPLDVDYTVFVHLERDGEVVAQDDRSPGSGHYPTTWWETGDELIDTHVLDAPYDPTRDRLWVGWYELGSMQHLRVLDRDAQPGATRLALD